MPLDRDYKQMMFWVGVALVCVVIASLVIVHYVIKAYGS
jgi:hypothetical protein